MSEISAAEDKGRYKGVRLVHFEVERLFDEFTYSIPMCLNHRVTAITAPNGAGKTLCLRLISALFEQKWSTFSSQRFAHLIYRFTDGTEVKVAQAQPAGADRSEKQRPKIILTINDTYGPAEDWTIKAIDPRRVPVAVDRYLPFLTRRGPEVWTHDLTGETYSLQEVLDDFGGRLPEPFKDQWYRAIPDRLKALVGEIDCHLIRIQRLLILRDQARDLAYYTPSPRRPSSTLAISRKAQKLKDIIASDFGNYATLSQSLDRSFPRRVINNASREPYDDLEERLQDLDRRRTELMNAGILDTETEEPVALPEGGELDKSMAQILSIYADDNDRKLSSLSSLLRRITLFKELIDERFTTKDVRTNRANGIEVTYQNRKVPIEALSSGEQHQLVLFFELLFEIKENALILIDEPELSLHVAWQKKFVGDLMKIIDLNKFDVILATHSPQLISRWTDLVVELGNIYDDDDLDGEVGRA